MAESGLFAPRWLPAPLARSVRYVQALRVLAWDEYVLSHVTLASSYHRHTSGNSQCWHPTTELLEYKWVSEGNSAAKGMRTWIHDVTQTPTRGAKRLQTFSADETNHQTIPFLIGWVLLPPGVAFELSVNEALLFGADDCELEFWMACSSPSMSSLGSKHVVFWGVHNNRR